LPPACVVPGNVDVAYAIRSGSLHTDVLSGIGLAFVVGQRMLGRRRVLARIGHSPVGRALPALSAAAITVAGIVTAIGAARGLA
jgi:hypothetical protein